MLRGTAIANFLGAGSSITVLMTTFGGQRALYIRYIDGLLLLLLFPLGGSTSTGDVARDCCLYSLTKSDSLVEIWETDLGLRHVVSCRCRVW